MTLVAPVGLQEQPALQDLPYFTFLASYDDELEMQNGKWQGYQNCDKGATYKVNKSE